MEAAGVAATRETEIAKLPEGARQVMRDKFAAADAAKPEFDATIESMAAEAGGVAKLADIKGPSRSVAKVLGDYNGAPAKIKDLLRATIEVDSVDAARRAVALVFERFPVLPTGRRNLLDPGRQPEDGYRDAKFNVVLGNGVIAEVQISVPQMLAAKKSGGHDLYVQRESLTREWRGKILPDDVQAKVDDLNARMRVLYDAAWTDATNAPNSTAVNGAPLRLADPGSNVRGGSVSQAMENGTSGASGNRETGIPSTSNSSARGPNGGSFISTSTPIINGNADGMGLAGPQGSGTAAITERGLTVPLRYRLAEAGDLTTSHTNDLTANPAFPAELQPRDRARAASAEQISRIENAIKPELLGESVKASDGAPIVGPDAVVESGNARTIALRRAYESGKADAYRAWLADNAKRFGLTRQQVEGMRQPVLVRERLGDVDRAEFARQANESAVAAMSPTEQAMSDARRITDLSGLVANEDGTINLVQSAEFVRQFVGQVAPTERGGMLQANGQLSQAGMNRLRNAVFAKAYGDADILAMLTESTDANVRNILAGMLRAAPEVAKLADLAQAGARQDADIAGPLVEAVRLFSQLRSEGRTVQQFMAQGSMFGDGLSPEIASMLEAVSLNARAPKRIAEMITGMVDRVDAMGDVRQASMFGDAPTGADVVAGAAERAVMDSRLSMAAERFPALEVMTDGMEKPMPMAEFLAAVKVEADELAADAPLMQLAAECALLHAAG